MLGWSADAALAPRKCGAICWPERAASARVTHFDASAFDCRIAGEVQNFDPLNWVEKKELKKMGRFIQLALAASDFAMRMAPWKSRPNCRRSPAFTSPPASADSTSSSASTRNIFDGGPGKISPFFIPAAIINLASGHVSIRYGAKGPNSATATACSASAHAIGDAFKIIQRGDAEVMICRRHRSRDHSHGNRRIRRHARAFHAQ